MDALLAFVQPAKGEVRGAEALNRCLLVLGELGGESEEAQLCLTRMSLEVQGTNYQTINFAKQALASMNLSSQVRAKRLMELLSDEDVPAGAVVSALSTLGAAAAPSVP